MSEHDAMLYKPIEGQKVLCELCPHACIIPPGKRGFCRVRQNVAGKLKSLNYGKLVALGTDPIEKKPLFHFLPGTRSLSIAASGCNFRCSFCQNWQISQQPGRNDSIAGEIATPERVVEAAIAGQCSSISYTYTEPTIFFEFAYDTARLAKEQGLKNCFVTNGFISLKAIDKITRSGLLDAVNVDLKCFRQETYRKVMKGSLQPVLDAICALHAAGVWVEITTLIVPGMNDSASELGDIAAFIAEKLSVSVPWHVSRFHGDYEMSQRSATPIESLNLACRIGKDASLKYVYGGNAPGKTDEKTHCPQCNKIVIDREGFLLHEILLRNGKCPDCDEVIEGIWR